MTEEQFDENFDDLPLEPLELDTTENNDNETSAKPELLTIRLFKEAIKEASGNERDRLLENFAENVLSNLIQQLVGATAKGGQFFDQMDAEVAAGLRKPIRRDNAGDQSLVAHLLNGFFPTYRILKKLRTETPETNQVKRFCDDKAAHLFTASYLLHDFEKFPDYLSWLTTNQPEGQFKDKKWADKDDAPDFARGYLAQKIQDFGIDKFLGEKWKSYLNDIVWVSHNAGDGRDADLGLESRGLRDYQLDGRTRGVLSNLVKLSDRFASVVKHPSDVEKGSLPNIIGNLSNHQFKFSYHSLSDNRGVLTNILNNALMEAHPSEFYTPLLYLPDGVVYLATADAPAIKTDDIPEQVIAKIKSFCADKLKLKQTGFGRDGKGFKFAEYYWLFFNTVQLMEVSIDAACRLIPSTKTPSAKKRSDSLVTFRIAGDLPESLNVKFVDDYRIDRLAEFGDILCRGIWNAWRDRFNNWQKQQPKANRKNPPDLDLTQKLAEHLGLSNEISALKTIQSLRKTGGVPLDWYYLAAKYLQQNLGLDEALIREKMAEMVNYAASLIQPIIEEFTIPDGWNDLRTYVSQVISLPTGAVIAPEADSFLVELTRYNAAKITGRGRENVCAMSSSSFTVTEQMESATLFAPQVYSNRQILFNAQAAKRQICSIWSIEIMLRQILMNQTNATGGDFEGRKYRYLYLYPTYFFTPETNKFLQKAYTWIARTRFDADIRRHLIAEEQVAKFDIKDYQQVDSLLIQENLQPEDDRTFKLSYPPNQPLTFFFLALPPGKDATDTESWVMPAWLALALPLILDVKVVASESPVPPFISGADFEKTVLLDGEHQAIRSLIHLNSINQNPTELRQVQDTFRLDRILPYASDNREFSPLNALSAAYCIHLEVNRKKDGNPDWGKLAALARDLETNPLYVFHYLNKWLRKQDKIDSVPIAKVRLYRELYYYFEPEGDNMTKLGELTKLYRSFYRAKSKGKSPKANAILKPIDEAAEVILKFDKSIASDNESLIEIVAARLAKLMNNVRRKEAEGQPAYDLVDGKWRYLTSEEERQAVYKFAKYFVDVIFDDGFKSDRARLAGTQLNLIKDTCEYLYRLADDEYWKNRKQDEPADIPDVDAEDAA